MTKLIIFGAGEQAEVASFLFENDSNFEVVAFTVDKEFIQEDSFKNKPVVPFESIGKTYPPDKYEMFVAIGYKKMNSVRELKCHQAREKGYKLASYVSSRAIVWPDFSCGDNCLILEFNNIQPFVKIGNNVTLWSGNHIGHHSIVKDNSFVTSHVVVSGGVTIEENCFLGVNSTIADHVVVKRKCLVGAGALIAKSTKECGVYAVSSTKRSEISSDLMMA